MSSSQAEVWTISRRLTGVADGRVEAEVGSVCFQVSGEAARVTSFELCSGSDDESITRFVLALLGSRLQQLGASIVLPMEAGPMIEVAVEALLDEGEQTTTCCDTDGRPLLSLASEYVHEHRLCYLAADGNIVARA